jgi:MFS family permease
MPLLVLYQEQWSLSPGQLTLAFAVFAGGFLVALLTLGSLSDHIGRRPVLLGAMIIELGSNVTFLLAADIGLVILGRIMQGFATGAATSAFTAVLVELAPPKRARLGTVLGSVGLTGGLAAGSLLAGLAIQFTPAANSTIFLTLTAITALGTIMIALSPETVRRVPGALRSVLPHVAVPPVARREFAAAIPVIAAVWMLSGLTGGLAPSMVRSVFQLNSGLLNGLSGFIAPAISAVTGLVFVRLDSRFSMAIGIYASIAGAIGITGGAIVGNLPIMIVGQAIAGAAFGAAFTAALRLIVPLAAEHQRAGVASAIYLVSYTAFGIPIIIAGRVADSLGLVPTVFWYSVATVLLALISLRSQLRLRRSAQDAEPGTSP